jgi:hypothetical protein
MLLGLILFTQTASRPKRNHLSTSSPYHCYAWGKVTHTHGAKLRSTKRREGSVLSSYIVVFAIWMLIKRFT